MPARPWGHAPRKVFYGPYNRAQNTHSFSLCSGTFTFLPSARAPTFRLVLSSLSRSGSLQFTATGPRKEWVIWWKRANKRKRDRQGAKQPGNFHIYEVIARPFTMAQFLFARLLIFIKTVAGGWFL